MKIDAEIFMRTLSPGDGDYRLLSPPTCQSLGMNLIPALEGRNCGVGYQNEVRKTAKRRSTLLMNKAICLHYSSLLFFFLFGLFVLVLLLFGCGFLFVFITFHTFSPLLCSFFLLFIQGWSNSFIFSVHLPWAPSTLAVCPF